MLCNRCDGKNNLLEEKWDAWDMCDAWELAKALIATRTASANMRFLDVAEKRHCLCSTHRAFGMGVYAMLLMNMFWASDTSATVLAKNEALQIRNVTASAASVPDYGLFELKLDFGATYENPFDPKQIDAWAEFAGPEGNVRRVNGFLNQACTRDLKDGIESVAAEGEPFWQVRFAPHRTGIWRYRVFVKDRTGVVESPEGTFEATASTNPGFLTPHPGGRLFQFENGEPFIAIGENVCWSGRRGTYDYDDWLGALGKSGGNWIRIWMSRWHCGLEWSAEPGQPWDVSRFGGLGIYNLCNAWRLDTILDTAEKNGIQVMLCLGTYGELTTGGYFGEGMWDSNPYNAAMGGPCEKAEDFWKNERARDFYKQRLRYLAARYGWRTNVFAWEFWNEAKPPAEWLKEMSLFLKGGGAPQQPPADAFNHLVSTTYGKPELWKLDEVDFTMTHHYGEGNIPDETPVISTDALNHQKYNKPHLMAEFGIDWRSSDVKYDANFQGVNLHNGLWASLFSGNAGTAMIWYWDGYVHPGNLYGQFAKIRECADRIPWKNGPWNVLEIDAPEIIATKETFHDLTLIPTGEWGKGASTPLEITSLEGAGKQVVPAFLYGALKPELQTPLTFAVNYERPGRFEIKVGTVSINTTLRIALDGRVLMEKALSAQPVAEGVTPEYEKTEFRTEFGVYQAQFNKKYGIDIPAGEHTITVEVTEGDWLNAAEYVLGDYLSDRFAKLNIYGITNYAQAFAWVQNAAHHWMNVRDGVSIPAVAESKTNVHGLPDGRYHCTWRDTWSGETIGLTPCECVGGNLPVTIPPVEKDLVLGIVPEGDSAH